MEIKFKKITEDAILPRQNNPDTLTGDAGFDLFGTEQITVPARGSVIAPTGLQIADITKGYWFKIEGRSGLGFHHSVIPHPGVVDNQYRGELQVKLYNQSDIDVTIEKGKGIAQFVVFKMNIVKVSVSEEITSTARGEKGFGSSDV